jgi:cellulose synthase A
MVMKKEELEKIGFFSSLCGGRKRTSKYKKSSEKKKSHTL